MRIVRVFDIAVGQTVWMFPGGNAARNRAALDLRKGEITRIARKYFYVRPDGMKSYEVKFHKDTFQSACEDENSWYVLYENEDRFLYDVENAEMVGKIRQYFSRYGIGELSDEGIRTIFRVMEKEGCVK